jgi:hypothetical protein
MLQAISARQQNFIGKACTKHQVNYKNIIGVPKIDKGFENYHPVSEKNFEQKIVMFAVDHNLHFNSLNDLTKLIREAAKIPANNVQNLKLSRTIKIVLDTFASCQQKKRCEILRKTIFHHSR